jgi:hypothetical protein
MPNQAILPGGGQPGHTSRIHVDQQRVSLATSGFRQLAKCQTGQSGDTAQAVQSVDRVSPPRGGNHGDDLLFEAIPRRRHAQYGIEVAIEGRRGVTVVDALPTGHVSCNRSKGCPLNTLGLGAAAVWQPVPYSHQAGAGIFAGRTRSRTASTSHSGTVTAVISPKRSSRVSCAPSRASALAPSPPGLTNFDRAATTH